MQRSNGRRSHALLVHFQLNGGLLTNGSGADLGERAMDLALTIKRKRALNPVSTRRKL